MKLATISLLGLLMFASCAEQPTDQKEVQGTSVPINEEEQYPERRNRVTYKGHTIDVNTIIRGDSSTMVVMDRSGRDLHRGTIPITGKPTIHQVEAIDMNGDDKMEIAIITVDEQDKSQLFLLQFKDGEYERVQNDAILNIQTGLGNDTLVAMESSLKYFQDSKALTNPAIIMWNSEINDYVINSQR